MTTAFAYQVRDPRGNAHSGVIDAASADDAAQQLRRDGFQIVEIKEDAEDSISLIPRRVSRTEVMYMTNQLAVMVDTGIALSAALEGIASQEENPTLKRILNELRKAVEQGDDFSAALTKHPKLFDKTYVSLIKASEATGSFGPMLDRIATYLRKELDSRGKVRAAMAYPMVMLVLGINVTIFLLTFIMPKFTPLFASKGIKLPLPTKVLMVVSDAMIHYWWAWLIGAVAVVVGFVYGRRTEAGRRAWDTIKINLPLVGPMTRKVIISRSIRTLGTMLGSGIPVLDALKLSAEVSGNWNYEQLWKNVGDRVTEGSQVCESLSGNPLFPAMLVQMISAGEQTGQLGPVLERVGGYYEQEIETSLKALTSVIEPMMITVMGAVIGTIGMAIMLPIFSLSKGGG
ncbi:MAG TPA: type II secretion system F family protein [Nitrolancea sp.]|jgi:type IV pilus assembly protein PilC|nr:type II secretion system F family protein [Nitrolancea sp.]